MSNEQPGASDDATSDIAEPKPIGPKPVKLRLYEVERSISPLRRLAGYAASHPDTVRYMQASGERWVERLLAHPLPVSVAADAAELGRQFVGIDATQADERVLRIGEINALIARIDTLLGLPLDRLKFRRRSVRIYPRRQQELEPEPSADPGDATPTQPAAETAKRPPAAAKAPGRRTYSYSVPSSARSETTSPSKLPSGPWWLGEGIGATPLAERGLPSAWTDALATAEVSTSSELFALRPTGYESLRPVHGAGMDVPAGRVALGGRVVQRFTVLKPSGSRHSEALVRGAGTVRLVWRDGVPAPVFDPLVPGTRVVAIGLWSPPVGGLGALTDVELTAGLTQKRADLPQYDLDGVDDAVIRAAFRAVSSDLDTLRDPLPDDVVASNGLMSLSDALKAVHGGSQDRARGARRLAFEEAVYAQLGLAMAERADDAPTRGIGHPLLHQLVTRLTTWRNVSVDDAHLVAFETIKRELRVPRPMLRVLAGRPGDERERVALLSAVTVAESKSQVLWLLPDLVTAEALFTLFEPLLRELGLVSRLIADDPSRSVRDALRRGEVAIVFGTLGLASAGVQMRRLGLVIAQESEPGELDRRGLIVDGGAAPDVLVVPTRAIGAGHLLGPYAEHAVSWVTPTRWPRFQTMLVPASQREAAYQEVQEAISGGAQAIIALPMGKSGDLLEPEEAVRVRTTLETHLPAARIQLFHGALSREERNRRYEDFQRRGFEVLLATHAVEFGWDTPGATELIVEQADRMPRERLSRLLHRLIQVDNPTVRLIHGDDPDPAGMEVLRLLERGRLDDALASDTFETSEPRLSWLDPSADVDLLLAARAVAMTALATDPGLQRPQSADMARGLATWWPALFTGECPVTVTKSESGGRRRRRRRRRR